MESLKELYKIGKGPSSSHTIGPERICNYVKELYGVDNVIKVVLFGSLALTGEGHGTSKVIRQTLGDNVAIEYDKTTTKLAHANTMDVYVKVLGEVKVVRGLSVGGGSVKIEGAPVKEPEKIYPYKIFLDIKRYVEQKNVGLKDYVYEIEPDIKDYLLDIWKVMKASVEEGLKGEGVLSGGLNLQKKAKYLYEKSDVDGVQSCRQHRLISAYAFAVSEQNADNGRIVTAPTCGACGVLPSVLYYEHVNNNVSEQKIVDALAVAGLIGNIVKTNASISGAECGCQAEIGTACSMAAAALAEIYGLSTEQTECAAEIAMEHNLGLTCDPALGLVQIPCIERNCMAAIRALNSFCVAYYLTPMRRVTFDEIVKTMYETGKDLNSKYLETAKGGIAKHFGKNKGE